MLKVIAIILKLQFKLMAVFNILQVMSFWYSMLQISQYNIVENKLFRKSLQVGIC